ncbi:MAG: selenocysteine-specific translation elongation factor [Candidatus Dormibacteria bacterium]
MVPGLTRHLVATAGHVDHGKSTLVRALTGTDPDRLAEEKRRGLTIDLGFARMELPGREVGIVDVPGHARFIRNMLAGVHALDAVLLVIALDEGVMPQTREHLEVVTLLGARAGVVVLTKRDLVDEQQCQRVSDQVRAELSGSVLAQSELVPVAAASGLGLEQLRAALAGVLPQEPERDPAGAVRLPIDRVFVMPGFGTVVTGSLAGGSVEAGQELRLFPQDRPVRVRDLQVHNRSVRSAPGSTRVAVNLQGVDRAMVERGQLLASPGSVTVTRRADVRLTLLAAAPALRSGARLRFHSGTGETGARVRLFAAGPVPPGGEAWARLSFESPVPLVTGERFVVRRSSPAATVGGGRVADPAPRLTRPAPGYLEARLSADPARCWDAELGRHPRGCSADEVAAAMGERPARAGRRLRAMLEAGGAREEGGRWWSPVAWEAFVQEVSAALGNDGSPVAELPGRTHASATMVSAALAQLSASGRAEREGTRVWATGAGRSRAPEATIAALEKITDQGLGALSTAQVELAAGGRDRLRALVTGGDLVRLEDDLFVTGAAYARARTTLTAFLEEHGSVTVAQARDLLGSTRRVVVPLLVRLDSDRVTRREGDQRVLRAGRIRDPGRSGA